MESHASSPCHYWILPNSNKPKYQQRYQQPLFSDHKNRGGVGSVLWGVTLPLLFFLGTAEQWNRNGGDQARRGFRLFQAFRDRVPNLKFWNKPQT
jgi:hypothetical protein